MRKHIKTFIVTALACSLLLGAGISAKAESKVAINDTNFSAEVKREAEEADTNGDGYLSETEASKVKKLYFAPNYNLDSFKGIEYFPDITYFYYRGRSAGEYEDFDIIEESTAFEIDLSGFEKLERVRIDCRTPYLKTVNLEDCTKLKELTIEGSVLNTDGITSLNLDGCTNLQTVYCRDIAIPKLKLAGLKKLTEITVIGDNMETLNLKNCTKLKTVLAGGDRLMKLKLKGDKNLEELSVVSDSMENLDLSTNTKLKELSLDNVKIDAPDLSHNKNLTKLDCYQTEIISLDLRENRNLTMVDCHNNKMLQELKVKGCNKIKTLRCYNTALTKLNVKKNSSLTRLHCKQTQISKLNLKNNKKLKKLICTETNIQELDLSNTKIKDASGLECDPAVSVTYAD